MKVLGLSFGRKMKNCEILVKEALLEAQSMGAEVQFIRMIDLDIKPCTGCGGCGNSLQKGGSGRCIIKDDLPMVDEAFMESDCDPCRRSGLRAWPQRPAQADGRSLRPLP